MAIIVCITCKLDPAPSQKHQLGYCVDRLLHRAGQSDQNKLQNIEMHGCLDTCSCRIISDFIQLFFNRNS